MSPQLQAALVRALFSAVVAGALAAVAAYSQTQSFNAAIWAFVAAALGALGIRGAAEGVYDGHRAAKGLVHPSDVGQRAA